VTERITTVRRPSPLVYAFEAAAARGGCDGGKRTTRLNQKIE